MFGASSAPARPLSSGAHRHSIPYGDAQLAPAGDSVCRTRAGTPRAYHLSTKDGTCIHCGEYNAFMERPIGEGLK